MSDDLIADLAERLRTSGIEFDRIEQTPDGIEVHLPDGKVARLETEEQRDRRIQQFLDDKAQEERRMREMTFEMTGVVEPSRYSYEPEGPYAMDKSKRDRAKAQRKKMKRHKKRNR